MDETIAIIGAGPAGLGCAWRLRELGYRNFHVYEANDYVGGLSASFQDKQGFTWDIGGHVLFSHYPYFDDLVDLLLEKQYISHIRASWIRIKDRFVPYPFQNNLRYLPAPMVSECLSGLERASSLRGKNSQSFLEWIHDIFGDGIARYFMIPYNEKTWAFPLEQMSKNWIADRVSVVEYERAKQNVLEERDDVSWGPNSVFKFPKHGGTGAIFRAFLPRLESHVSLNKKCVRINTKTRTIYFDDDTSAPYDRLVSSAPLNELVSMLDPAPQGLARAAKTLAFTSGIMVGLGFSHPCPSDKCWMYFPEDKAPFYRLTYFSNYSPNNAPDENHFSLMTEVSYSPLRKINKSNVINEVIEGLISTGIIERSWAEDIISTYVIDVPKSYPVPTLERDAALGLIVPALEKMHIYSRGRFGLWIYEIGNTDHSVMQGKELADCLVNHKKEQTILPYTFLQGDKK